MPHYESQMVKQMTAFETRVLKELAQEQISHPVAEYTPERLEKLYAEIALAQRFKSPPHFTVNL